MRKENKNNGAILESTTMHAHSFYSILMMSMEGQKALGFHQKSLNLCSGDLTGLERHEGE